MVLFGTVPFLILSRGPAGDLLMEKIFGLFPRTWRQTKTSETHPFLTKNRSAQTSPSIGQGKRAPRRRGRLLQRHVGIPQNPAAQLEGFQPHQGLRLSSGSNRSSSVGKPSGLNGDHLVPCKWRCSLYFGGKSNMFQMLAKCIF